MDTLTKFERSCRMALVRSTDTKPEMLVRRLIFHLGFRYRLHARDLPGCPDVVFRSRKKVIFVHGCFWHRHSSAACKLARLPKSRQSFWSTKLEANRRRDQTNRRKLRNLGWNVLQIWECELKNIDKLQRRIVRFLQ
ncbi:MAG: DNA mismatch endonuclease Vsr [Acidobacteria bacterium]|nr:DNA mismatch endonuclease Vsr [Acidobacteriota bacterium]